MTLYELTRLLVARGCPEHPRLFQKPQCPPWWLLRDSIPDDPHHVRSSDTVHSDDARDLWTAHALRWVEPMLGLEYIAHLAHLQYGDNILEAIEAATRHLEKGGVPS